MSTSVDLHMVNFRYWKVSDRERYDRELRLARSDLVEKQSNDPALPILYQQLTKYQFYVAKEQTEPVHIKPFQYIHVLNTTTNHVFLLTGPKTITLNDNEIVVFGPAQMIELSPGFYCVVKHPVMRDFGTHFSEADKQQPPLHYGKEQIRYNLDSLPIQNEISEFLPRVRITEAFALYPGEELISQIKPLPVILADSAIVLQANEDFDDVETKEDVKSRKSITKEVRRKAGDEWLLRGPCTFIPHPLVMMHRIIQAYIITPNRGLRIQAQTDLVDAQGIFRKSGEEWIVDKEGGYLPATTKEIIMGYTDNIILSDSVAVHVRALRSFVQENGTSRKTGEEYLITKKDMDVYQLNTNEQFVSTVHITTLTQEQYCIINNPLVWDEKEGVFLHQYGSRKLVKGPTAFFLHPGEETNGIKNAVVLTKEEALHIRVMETFYDEEFNQQRYAGQTFYLYGPKHYIPPLQVELVQKREALLQVDWFGWTLNSLYWWPRPVE